MEQKSSIWQNLDWVTVGLYLLLVTLGWFNIYSAVYTEEQSHVFDFSLRYGRQLIWIFASIGIIFTALILDSKFYSAFSLIIYIAVILMLIGVLIVGKATNGATSWFAIGPFKFQPSEFAKFATSLAVASYLSKYNLKPNKLKTLIQFSIIALLPSILILLQNDTGSALVFFIFFLVFFREGMPLAYLLVGFLTMILFVLSLVLDTYIVLIVIETLAFITFYIIYKRYKVVLKAFFVLMGITISLFLLFNILEVQIPKEYIVLIGLGLSLILFLYKIYKDKINQAYLIIIVMLSSMAFTYTVDIVFDRMLDGYQQRRIKVLLGIESDPYGAGYNVNQSIIAIGSGGVTGKGYLQGTQTKFKFVPEQSTDFIFCTVGEEWGFAGTLLVLGLFLTLILRLIFLAERQKSKFSRIYGYSVASIIFFHVVINVGMTIGLAPVIGIPLPFFSYGGSSLWGFTFLLFIFLKLDVNRTQLIQ